MSLLGRVLRLPGAGEVDTTLASMPLGSEHDMQVSPYVGSLYWLRCQPLVASVGLEQALEFVKYAGASSCVEVAPASATSALRVFVLAAMA